MPPNAPTDEELLLGLSNLDDEQQMLQRQLARAHALRGRLGRQYETPFGAALAGIGDIIGGIRAGGMEKDAEAQQAALRERAMAGRQAGLRMASGLDRDVDVGGLLTGEDATLEERQKAIQEMLGRQNRVGAALASSGDRQLAALGQQLITQAGQGQGRYQEAIGKRLQLGQDRQKAAAEAEYRKQQLQLDRDKLNADVYTTTADPATGGFLKTNRRTGESTYVPPQQVAPPPGGGDQPLPGLPGKPTEDERKRVNDARTHISQIKLAMEKLKAAPGAYGGVVNTVAGMAEKVPGLGPLVQSVHARTLKPEELSAKDFVTNVVSGIIKARAGGSVTLNEELRQKFLPAESDSLENVMQKLNDLLELETSNYNTASSGRLPPAQTKGGAEAAATSRADSYY